MATISTFTPVSYIRSSSCVEGALSALSQYFYLGGNQAKVIRNDEVQLEPGRISSCTIALKIASYVLLFPLTLTLLVIHLSLRYQHNFTVISSSTPPHSIAEVTAQNVESVRQQVLAPSNVTENLFQPSEKSLSATPTSDEVSVKHSEEIPSPDKEAEPLSLEEFKKKLKYFDTDDKDSHTIAKDLFTFVPKTLELAEVVDLIFEQCSEDDITLFLDAILIARPSFTLSPYDEIRRKIVEDERHVLNNSSLIALFKEHALEADEDKLTACYDLAYRLNHPYLYRLSRAPILPSDYSLNFLWVNLNPQDRVINTAQSIFGDGLDLSENAECIRHPQALRRFEENEESLKEESLEDWKKIKKSFTYRISKWADINPGAQINLWYDSALVTQQAQQKTFEMMRGISESRGVNLTLRDIRQLSNIGGEIGNSLHPGTQVYYRVDILKALIADHMISSEDSSKYCVVSDVDVQPMSPQQMLDQRTVEYLSSTGYVFNRVSLLGNFENSFFIFNKENENLKKVHYKTIIKRTAANITSLRQYPIGTGLRPDYILDAQFVFKQYAHFRRRMKESESWEGSNELAVPRKVVQCPRSQFNFGGNFSKSDYQSEIFRFIGDSNVPYTINGRNFRKYGEGQIEELIRWKAEPLPIVVRP